MELFLWLGPELGGSSAVCKPCLGAPCPISGGFLWFAGEDRGWELHPWDVGFVPGSDAGRAGAVWLCQFRVLDAAGGCASGGLGWIFGKISSPQGLSSLAQLLRAVVESPCLEGCKSHVAVAPGDRGMVGVAYLRGLFQPYPFWGCSCLWWGHPKPQGGVPGVRSWLVWRTDPRTGPFGSSLNATGIPSMGIHLSLPFAPVLAQRDVCD